MLSGRHTLGLGTDGDHVKKGVAMAGGQRARVSWLTKTKALPAEASHFTV